MNSESIVKNGFISVEQLLRAYALESGLRIRCEASPTMLTSLCYLPQDFCLKRDTIALLESDLDGFVIEQIEDLLLVLS